jgi:hypothetical protein
MGFALCLGLSSCVTAGSERTEDAVVVVTVELCVIAID